MGVALKGLDSTRNWLQGLTKSLPEAQDNVLSNHLPEMESEAKKAVETVVYLAYNQKHYVRTMALLNAVKAVKLEGSKPSAGIIIDLTDGVQAKLDNSVSYARFFLPEEAARSFLRHHENVPYVRDFLSVWKAHFAASVPELMIQAIDLELAK